MNYTKILAFLFGFTCVANITLAQNSQVSSYNPLPSKSYERVFVPLKPIQDAALVNMNEIPENIAISTSYFDGLGRVIQTVSKQSSPQKTDMVAAVAYDDFDRITKGYLPFTPYWNNATKNNGLYKSYALVQDSIFHKNMFPTDADFFYSQTNVEASPLQRVLKVMPQGAAWVGANVGKQLIERANTATDSVRLWNIDINSEDDIPTTTTMYSAGSLLVQEAIDEAGVKKQLFKNERGELVLVKVQLSNTPSTGHTGWLCTYYIYDEAGSLRTVIPPQAVENIKSTWVVNNSTFTDFCYTYFYDAQKRNITKRIPGSTKVFYIYDFLGRLVLTQDGNQRKNSKWSFIKYDDQNRPTQSGIITINQTRNTIADNAAASSNYPTLTGTYTVHSETFYDSYNWLSQAGYPIANSNLVTNNITTSNFSTDYNNFPYPLPIVAGNKIRNTVTGSKRLILGTNTYLYTLSIYDVDGRVIQVKQTNATGGTDVVTNQYSYVGKVLNSHIAHQKNGTNNQTHSIATKYNYDHAGRLLNIDKKIDNDSYKTIAANNYNYLGQLINKTIGVAQDPITQGDIETQQFDYNIRGWLLGVNRDYLNDATNNSFGYELGYNSANSIMPEQSFANTKLTGSITGVIWKGKGDGEKRKYDYSYDNANRLISADFNQFTDGTFNKTANVDYSVSNLTYDANSNILTMQQKAYKLGSSETIDNLQYSYVANKLQNVVDVSGTAAQDNELGDFTDLSTSNYLYDSVGNTIKNLDKRANYISYNYLNLPDTVRLKNKTDNVYSRVIYTYDAAGTRLQKKVIDSSSNPPNTTTIDYVSGFIYQNSQLQLVGQEEGRIRILTDNATNTPLYIYDYFIKDHLGNTRAILSSEQKTDIYHGDFEDNTNEANAELFENYNNGNIIEKPSCFDEVSSNEKVQVVGAAKVENPQVVGAGKLLKVMAGDHVNARVYGWFSNDYTNTDPVENLTPIHDVLLSLLGGGINKYVSTTKATQLTAPDGLLSSGISQFLEQQDNYVTDNGGYLNWILLDEEQFKMVSSVSGFESFMREANGSGCNNKTMLDANGGNGIEITKNGYLYIYVSNTNTQYPVYFDELHIEHQHSSLIEENSYYPFGLSMANISSKAVNGAPANTYKYNGKEEERKELSDGAGLEWMDYGARMYDAQTGRWLAIDPLAEVSRKYSPYTYAYNNPIMFVDPDGMLARPTAEQTGVSGDENLQDLGNDISRMSDKQHFVDYTEGLIRIAISRALDEIEEQIGTGSGNPNTIFCFAQAIPYITQGLFGSGAASAAAGSFFKLGTNQWNIPAPDWNAGGNAFKSFFTEAGITIFGMYLEQIDNLTKKYKALTAPTTAVTATAVVASATPAVNPELVDKYLKELKEIYTKIMNQKGMVYALVAVEDGNYNVYTRGSKKSTSKTPLKELDIWKIGETTNPKDRYDGSYLLRENVKLVPLFTGTLMECKIMEKIYLLGYQILHSGDLPPGNKIRR